jgi:nitrogen fixation protein NifQ
MTLLAPLHDQTSSGQCAPVAEAIYQAIVSEPTLSARADPFTGHVLACVLAIGLGEVIERGDKLSDAIGLGRADLDLLTAQWAPAARRFLDLAAEPAVVARDEEEEQLHELLTRFKSDASPLCGWIVSIVARRSMAPTHLWQDLGLFERPELTRLMTEWFPALAAANTNNMKWKKFFYRQLCELEGFSLCAAPTCRECDDFDNCFGEEGGASALARLAHR